jgi:hypothetical protein
MTRDDFIAAVRTTQRHNMRRVYVVVAALIISELPLVILACNGLIKKQTFQIVLAVYAFVSVSVASYFLRRYGSRDMLCPKCQKPLWRKPEVYRVLASGCCVHCGHILISNHQVA